jgi:predicted lipid-binding transport protein (Tim44 family)
MGRIIGTILGAILAIWLVFMAAGGIFATLKTFLIIGLIAMAIFIVVWLVASALVAANTAQPRPARQQYRSAHLQRIRSNAPFHYRTAVLEARLCTNFCHGLSRQSRGR